GTVAGRDLDRLGRGGVADAADRDDGRARDFAPRVAAERVGEGVKADAVVLAGGELGPDRDVDARVAGPLVDARVVGRTGNVAVVPGGPETRRVVAREAAGGA